jgi:translation initiation factor 2 subunit 2
MADFDYSALYRRAATTLPKTSGDGERFQIPAPDVMQEGKTTTLRNFSEIAESLRRDPQHILTYLLRELGTGGTLAEGRVIFKGRVLAPSVAEKVSLYFETFVKCHECGRPDSHFVKEGRTALVICEACGASRPISAVRARKEETEKEKLTAGKEIDVQIQEISKRGDGVVRMGDIIIYVPGTRSGDQVKIRIEKVSGSVAFAKRMT